jgi:membrane protease YdiL (CAAX protease family)
MTPGPEWKEVGERLVQKRDYLAWHNVVLLIFNALLLASCVLLLLIMPILFEIDPMDPDSVDRLSDATFVLFTLIIQDGILIWMVWHQVVRRRVIPLSEMGISRAQLTDAPSVAKNTMLGVSMGVVLFFIAIGIEAGQSSIGFEPPSDVVIGPTIGDFAAYLTWIVSGCIIAPVSEEFFFRGYAFYAFNKRHGLAVGLFVSALGFSFIHTNIYALLPIFVAGVGLALSYHWTKSLVTPMAAHAVYNFIILTMMYTGY